MYKRSPARALALQEVGLYGPSPSYREHDGRCVSRIDTSFKRAQSRTCGIGRDRDPTAIAGPGWNSSTRQNPVGRGPSVMQLLERPDADGERCILAEQKVQFRKVQRQADMQSLHDQRMMENYIRATENPARAIPPLAGTTGTGNRLKSSKPSATAKVTGDERARHYFGGPKADPGSAQSRPTTRDEKPFSRGKGYVITRSATHNRMVVEPEQFFGQPRVGLGIHQQLKDLQARLHESVLETQAAEARESELKEILVEEKEKHKFEMEITQRQVERKERDLDAVIQKAVATATRDSEREKKEMKMRCEEEVDTTRIHAQREMVRFETAVDDFKKMIKQQEKAFEKNLQDALEEKEKTHFYSSKKMVLEATQKATAEGEEKVERALERSKEEHLKAMQAMNDKHVEQMRTLHELYDRITTLGFELREAKDRIEELEKSNANLLETVSVARLKVRELEQRRKVQTKAVDKYKLGYDSQISRVEKDYEFRLILAKSELCDLRKRFSVMANNVCHLRAFLYEWEHMDPKCKEILDKLDEMEPYSEFAAKRRRKHNFLVSHLTIPESTLDRLQDMSIRERKAKLAAADAAARKAAGGAGFKDADNEPNSQSQGRGEKLKSMAATAVGRSTSHNFPPESSSLASMQPKSGRLVRSFSEPSLRRPPVKEDEKPFSLDQAGVETFLDNVRNRKVTGRRISWKGL